VDFPLLEGLNHNADGNFQLCASWEYVPKYILYYGSFCKAMMQKKKNQQKKTLGY